MKTQLRNAAFLLLAALCLVLAAVPAMADETLYVCRMNIVPQVLQQFCQLKRKILVQLDLHRTCGTSGTGKSSSAEEAANAMAARTSSVFKLGKLARISSAESPAAKLASTAHSSALP